MQKLFRRCAQCRLQTHRSVLLRIRRQADGSLTLRDDGIGRSLYFCRSKECLLRGARNKSMLKHQPGLAPELWRSFCEQLASRVGAINS